MESKPKFKPDGGLKLMDQVRQVMRYHNYSYRTEQTYCDWIVRFIRFHGTKRHPKDMGKSEVKGFLSHLATDGKVSASTQRQALNAIVILYRDVLDQAIQGEIAPVRAKRHASVPVVLTQGEVQRVLREMHGSHLLMANLLYGGGLRLTECVRLRVQDLDFEKGLVYLRVAKGGKDRTTLFAKAIHSELRQHLDKARQLHEHDLEAGQGEVYMPESLARKYRGAAKEFRWQYVFPSKSLGTEPRAGVTRRHHLLESGLQKAVKVAVDRAGIQERVNCHTFRHGFATHLLENGVNIRVVQELMGHADVKTTEIYTHVMQKDVSTVVSPLDHLERLTKD